MQRLLSAVVVVGCLAIPSLAGAQSAIAGVVRDTTGAVLPGATVEASSPALIERVRSAVTNEAGQYRIVDLRPGTYTVVFTLPGFNTVRREGIVLEANFTAPINVEMRIGAIEETIVVTGESPIVDVQSSHRREVVTQEQLELIPTGRNFQLVAGTVPAVSAGVFDVGGSSAMWTGGSLLAHGSQTRDSRTLIDGMVVDAMFGGGQCACVYDNEAQSQEIAVQISGGAAEHQLAGVVVDRIPRSGGNTFSGDTTFLFGNGSLQGENVDDALRARGITAAARLHRLYDVNFSLGGPVLRDKLWFFATGRHWAYNNYVANAFFADGRQAIDDNDLAGYVARLTSQVTRRNRVTAMFDWSSKNRGHRGLSATVAPEASWRQSSPAEHIAQVKWTSTLSSKLLLELGYSHTRHHTLFRYNPAVEPATCFRSFDQCAPGTSYGSIAKQDLVLNRFWNAASSGPGVTAPTSQPAMSRVVLGSMQYVTGAHNLKVGFQQRFGWARFVNDPNGDLRQQYRSGMPFQVLVFNTPVDSIIDVNADLGVYVQDTWTLRRLTLSPGVRWDYFNSEIPEQRVPAGRFVPERFFERVKDVPNWHNVSPRFGAAYDLFGNGRTAVKGHIGVYVQSEGPGFANTYNPVVFSTDTRSWNDLNADDIAQENELGPTSNLTFGVRRNRNPDPDIKRPRQWVANAGVQHEVLRGLGVSVTYVQRSYHDMTWTDNLAISPADYTLLTVSDPRGNGQLLPVYSINPAVFGLVNELDTNSSANTRRYRGVDVTLNWRLPGGGTMYGGTSTGRVLENMCEVEDLNSLRFCNRREFDIPYRTSFSLAGSYPLPYDIRASWTLQSSPGSERAITYLVPRALAPGLTQSSVNVRLNDPGTEFNDRVTQLDLSLTKIFRHRGVQVRPELGLFNLLNANPVLGQTNAFGPNLGNANLILDPRLVRLGLHVKW
jgi:hypothetical protein